MDALMPTGCKARDTALALPELLALVVKHLSIRELICVVPAVCRRWRAFARTIRASVELDVTKTAAPTHVVKLIAARLPKTQNLALKGMPVISVSHLRKFEQLHRLQLPAQLFENRHYAAVMRLGVASLGLAGVRLPGLQIMAKQRNDRLHDLSLQMSSTYALHSSTRSGVVKLAQSAPNLRALRLRRVPLDRFDLAAVLTACPQLHALEVWMPHNDTSPECLASINEHGAALQDVLYTRRRTFSFVDGVFRSECDRNAYVREAFSIFERRPNMKRLRLRNTEHELHKMAAVAHRTWTLPPGCTKPSLKLEEHTMTLLRI